MATIPHSSSLSLDQKGPEKPPHCFCKLSLDMAAISWSHLVYKSLFENGHHLLALEHFLFFTC